MEQLMMKMEKLIVIDNKNITCTIIFCLLSSVADANTSYSADDLEQFNKYHICQKCDLSSAVLEGKENSILDGSNLMSARIEGQFVGSSFIGSTLTLVNSSYLNAMVSNFSESRCNNAKFYKASLSGSNFQNADLSKVNFKASNLSSVDFTNANLKGANLDFTILIGAKLTEEQLKSAKSYYCAVLPDGTLAPPEYQSHNCINRW